MKKLTKEQLQLIEEAKYGVAAGIYDETDIAYYAEQLKMKLTEVKNLVGMKNINENLLASVGAPVAEEAMQPAIDELHEMTANKMREATKELLKGGKSKCIYEKWVKEGYLTEDTCTAEIAEEMMKDNDIAQEMYESCMNVNECGEAEEGSWMQTRAGAKGQVFESEEDEENSELPVPIEDEPETEEMGGEEENPEDVVKVDVPLLIRLLEFAKENAETDVDLHQLAQNLVTMMEEDPDRVLRIEDYEQILQDLADLDTGDKPEDTTEPDADDMDDMDFDNDDEVANDDDVEQIAEEYVVAVYKDPRYGNSVDVFNGNDDLQQKAQSNNYEILDTQYSVAANDVKPAIARFKEKYQINESELAKFSPKKGSSIDGENEKAEEETLKTVTKDVDAQSETQEEKVENLRNQKHNASEEDLELIYKMKGKTPADFTLDIEDPQYEERVKMEMETGDSRKRDEDVVGPKANVGDAKVFTITPDGEDVGDSVNGGEEEYKKYKERKKIDHYSSLPINIKNLKLNEQADQKIDRIKELIGFDSSKSNKVAKINEEIDFMKVYNKFKKEQKK